MCVEISCIYILSNLRFSYCLLVYVYTIRLLLYPAEDLSVKVNKNLCRFLCLLLKLLWLDCMNVLARYVRPSTLCSYVTELN